MMDLAIKVEGLGKKYLIGKEKSVSLSSTLSDIFKSSNAKGDEFWALKDVSFEVKRGDVIGIIGKNGAGKSTLLKILSQITKPTEGRIEISGRVASLLEVGTGFHPELTGRENIFLNGTILGMSGKEVKDKFDEIVKFSGIEKFIDTPVKRYSSGMYVRLAFAVAAHLEPEILIIDEVLAVGDAEFQKKCLGKMKDVAGEGRTVIFVSHDMASIQNICVSGILLKKGQIHYSGPIKNVINKYLELETITNRNFTSRTLTNQELGNVLITKFDVLNKDQAIVNSVSLGEHYFFKIGFNVKQAAYEVKFRIAFVDSNNITRFFCNNSFSSENYNLLKSFSGELICEIPKFPLPAGKYYVHLTCYSNNGVENDIERAFELNVENGDFYGTGKTHHKSDGVYVMNSFYLLPNE